MCNIATYYIGCLRAIGSTSDFGDPNRRQGIRRKIEIENLNRNIIELTLWDEMAKHFDQADIKNMEQPVIIAVSSCQVSEYRDYQLSASLATYYYLNPNIPEAAESRAVFKARYEDSPTLIICKLPYQDIQQEKTRNKFPLKTIMEHNPNSYKGVRFTAEATITGINLIRDWYYISCHQCGITTTTQGYSYTYLDHDPQPGPFF
ncbi:nucleic acid-binding, OB-fold protein, partial [Tanacetum coccineum]